MAKEGGTRYALSFSKFQTLNINLPTKPIQDKIEKMLLLFERQIEQAETILNTLESQKKALLQQLFI